MSAAANPNSLASVAMVEEFARCGVNAACVSPGSRNTALITALAANHSIDLRVITDERCAAFFALGMARESGRPVLAVCTSGTAAANFLPAAAEANLAQVPLILLTADRPPELRECNAPQTIDQVRLYGSHVRWSVDALVPATGANLEAYYRSLAARAVDMALHPPRGPVHINLPMREPLVNIEAERAALAAGSHTDRAPKPPWTRVHPARMLPTPQTLSELARRIEHIERGLILCGPGTAREARDAIARLARRLGWPILADPLSGVRFGAHDRSMVIDSYEILLRDAELCARLEPQAVLQFGRPTTSKALLTSLGLARPSLYLILSPPGCWPDPNLHCSDLVHADPQEFCHALFEILGPDDAALRWAQSWQRANATIRAALRTTLEAESAMFEGKVLTELISLLPDGSELLVGSSMPVRDLDLFAATCPRDIRIEGNRGANGIDGVMSAAMGAAALRNSATALVIGDLSLLHDLGALQIAARYPLNLLIVLINNDGGGIFSFLPQVELGPAFEPLFGTPHGLDPEPAVRMCGGRFARASSWESFAHEIRKGLAARGLSVVEIRTDRARNLEQHREFIGAALARLKEQGAADRS